MTALEKLAAHRGRLARFLFQTESLVAKAVRASMWSGGGFALQKALQLGSNLILTRLLVPEAFGLMALVTVFLLGIELLADIGVKPAVIRSTRGEDPDFLATAWTIQILRGFVLFAASCLLAWPYSLVFSQPLLFPLISFCALSLAARGLASIRIATLNRDLALSRLTLLQLGVQIATIATTVSAVAALKSIWGIAIGTVFGGVLHALLSHLALPPAPHRLRFEKAAALEILRFGRWILLGTMFTFLGGRGLQALQGYYVALETLALIAIAETLSWALLELTKKIVGMVGFPTLSQIVRERPADLRHAVGRLQGAILLGAIPCFLALSALAQPLIDLLYDPRYAGAGVFLAFLALNAALGVLPLVYQNTLLATGDSRAHSAIMALFSGLRILGTIAGFWVGGAVGMMVGAGIASLVIYFASMAIAVRRGHATAGFDLLMLLPVLLLYSMHVFTHFLPHGATGAPIL